jgi:hypothetical protein
MLDFGRLFFKRFLSSVFLSIKLKVLGEDLLKMGVDKYATVLKIISILCGIGLIILGGFNLGLLAITKPIQFILPIYYM